MTALEVLPDPYKSMAQTLLEICGYAGNHWCYLCAISIWYKIGYVHYSVYIQYEPLIVTILLFISDGQRAEGAENVAHLL